MAAKVILDVVGARETKDILGVELQRISRWMKLGKLPPPYAKLRLSPVWVRADIERMRDEGKVTKYVEPPDPPLLLGTSEVADLLDVGKSQVARWRSRPNKSGPTFPEPSVRIQAGPIWSRPDIERFARAREAAPEPVRKKKPNPKNEEVQSG